MLDRLSQADRVSGIGAAVALVSTFLPWYHFDTSTARISQNAFGTGFLGDVLFFTAMGTILLLLIRHEVIVMRNGLPFREGQAFFALGCVGLAAVVLQMLIGVNGSGDGTGRPPAARGQRAAPPAQPPLAATRHKPSPTFVDRLSCHP